MDYKERIIDILTNKELTSEQEKQLETIFPELAESEDERIRNEIIAFVVQSIHRGGGTPIPEEQENKWLTWLEKQKPIELNQDDEKIRKAILNYFTKCWGNCKDDVCGMHVEDVIAWLEKQGEQK